MSIFDDLLRLTRQLHLAAEERARSLYWRPAADVYRTRYGWLIKMELPGVRCEDIELRTCGRLLMVRGKRTDHALLEECSLHSLEITYTPFERSIEFPTELDATPLSVEYQDGMLWIRLSTMSDE